MKVRELVNELQKLPDEAEIILSIEDYEHEFEFEAEEELELVEWSNKEKKIYLVGGRRKNNRGRSIV